VAAVVGVTSPEHDVVVVGGSLAGCAAATMFARRGLSVAVVERQPRADAYKTICTHYIQGSATPTIERLGLRDAILAAGGVENAVSLWTRYGWIAPAADARARHGYSIRRTKLDPIVRDMAAGTGGVELMQGLRATSLVVARGRITGVRVRAGDRSERELTGRLVVAADGRASELAAMAKVPGLRTPNRRFAYWSYFRGLPTIPGPVAGTGQLWFLDPHVAYALPNDDGLMLVAFWGLRKDLDSYRGDVDRAVRARIAELPDGPALEQATQEGAWLGRLEMPNVYRLPAHRGMALIGDAALSTDPLWGCGCGWALQSAEWLVQETADALAAGRDVRPALRRYQLRHARELLAHHLMICDYSTGRRMRPPERLLFAAAARDATVASTVHAFAARTVPVGKLLSPMTMGRAAITLALPALRRPAATVLDISRRRERLAPR
jgi:2-polyprenyl-6-methoxyphenol hydroxylase-like FAD-dependent oxidoreductase